MRGVSDARVASKQAMDARFAGFIVACFAEDGATCAGSVRAIAFQAGGPSGLARRDVVLTVDEVAVPGPAGAPDGAPEPRRGPPPPPPPGGGPPFVFYDTPVAQLVVNLARLFAVMAEEERRVCVAWRDP